MSNSNNQRLMLQSTNNLTYVGSWNGKHFLTATAVWEPPRVKPVPWESAGPM